MKLTSATVATLRLPPGKNDAIFFDDEIAGFGIRLRAGGKRSWVVQYRAGKQQRRLNLGSVEVINIKLARETAKTTLAKVQLGNDPQAEKAEIAAKASLTLGRVAEQYLGERRKILRPRSFDDVQRHLRQHWSSFANTPLNKIRRADIAARMSTIALENGSIAAKRCRSSLSAFFSWAVCEGLLDENPVVGTSRGPAERPRERVLTDTELIFVWNALPDHGYGAIIKVLMLTGQRRDEIGALRWSEINWEKRQIFLESARTKNGVPHEVPLSDAAIAILQAQPKRDGRLFIFGEGRGGYQGYSKSKKGLDAALGETVAPWRVHDLRRTVATGLAELGVLPHVVEAVLNHCSGHKRGVAGVYNRAIYAAEKRQALNTWALHVQTLINGCHSDVIALHRGGGCVAPG